MNIIELKKKYEKIFRVKLEGHPITYRPFNAHEMILILRSDDEDKYKEAICREAVFEKEIFDTLDWASIEMLYKKIGEVSGFGSQENIIKRKLELKEELENNPYLVMIKQIIATLPTIDINDLLKCNADQLLFYTVLCEELSGKKLIETDPLKVDNNRGPIGTQKKASLSQGDLNDIGMDASSGDLMQKLNKHGAEVKQFTPKPKVIQKEKDFAEE